MSKEVIFAGVLAVVCLVLVAVAFIYPERPKPAIDEGGTVQTTDTTPPPETDAGGSTASTSSTTGGFTGVAAAPTAGFTGGTTSSASTFTTTGGTTGTGFTVGGGTTSSASTFTTGGGSTGLGTTGLGTTGLGTTGGATSSSTGFGTTGTSSTFTTGGATGTSFTGGAGSTGAATGGTFTGGTTGGSSDPTGITATEKSHTVASGETLAEISQKYYNTTRQWKRIRDANAGLDPNALKVGQKIVIPALPAGGDAVASTTPPVVGDGERTYVVKRDDSYYKIAQRELGNAARWRDIEQLNGIPPEDLRVGQTIKLPARAAATTTAPDRVAPAAGDGRTHTVASGETLADISKRYFGTTTKWKEILKANPGVDANAMKVGQKLAIPELAGGAGAAQAAPAADGDYVVKTGDTVRGIAERELGSEGLWKRIIDANPGINPNRLRVGQVLKLPRRGDDTRPARAPSEASGATGSGGFSAGATTGGFSAGGTTGSGAFSAGGSTGSGAFSAGGSTGGSTGTFTGGGSTGTFTGGGSTGTFTGGGTGGSTGSGSATGTFTGGGTSGGTSPDRVGPAAP